jgi:hypothetical protein
MAARALDVGELRELVAVLAQALAGALFEVEMARESPIPSEHEREVRELLVERKALVETFKRVPEGELRGRLRSIFKDERESAYGLGDGDLEMPEIERETIEEVDLQAALERVRAAMLFDPELTDVVRRDAPRV